MLEPSHADIARRKTLVVLAGGQITPNILAVRMFSPRRLIVLHTSDKSSVSATERLRVNTSVEEFHPCPLSDGFSSGQVSEELARAIADFTIDLDDLHPLYPPLWRATESSIA